MTLSAELRNVDLTLECERCGHLIIKKGVWFVCVSTFKCVECKSELRLTYSDKIALFAKHAAAMDEGVLVGGRPGYARSTRIRPAPRCAHEARPRRQRSTCGVGEVGDAASPQVLTPQV